MRIHADPDPQPWYRIRQNYSDPKNLALPLCSNHTYLTLSWNPDFFQAFLSRPVRGLGSNLKLQLARLMILRTRKTAPGSQCVGFGSSSVSYNSFLKQVEIKICK